MVNMVNMAGSATLAPLADTPQPPYYAVIFTSVRTPGEDDGYGERAAQMLELAAAQPGFLGVESAGRSVGITVSYWADLESIKAWKAHAEHRQARRQGHARWYQDFRVRIAKVERDYAM